MPLHSVILTNRGGMVLFKKYFDGAMDDEALLLHEQALAMHSEHLRSEAFATDQVLALDDVAIIFRGVNDVLFFVGGTDEYNELILLEVLQLLVDILAEICGARDRVEERYLLTPDVFGKFSVCLDQMIFQGHLEDSDLKSIMRLSKMKAPSN